MTRRTQWGTYVLAKVDEKRQLLLEVGAGFRIMLDFVLVSPIII